MNSDSDDEIGHLRAAALSTRPSNMRKRKVTLINSRNVVTGESDAATRKIFVNPRKVVIGAKFSSSKQTQENSATTSNNDDDSDSNWPRAVMDSYAPKKPKLQSDHRTSSTSEKQVKTGKDQRIFTASKEKRSKKFAPDEDIDFDKDVRIILDDDNEDGAGMKDNVNERNKAIEIDCEDELEIIKNRNKIIDVDDGVSNDEAEDVSVEEERLTLRKIEITSSGQRTEGEDIDEEDEDKIEEGNQGMQDRLEGEEEDEKETQDEHLEEEQQKSEEEKRKVGVEEKHIKNVKEVEKVKSGIEKKLKDNENLYVVMHEDSVEGTSKKDENKPSKTGKNGKSPKKKTEITNVAKREKNSAGKSSDDESSGSNSDSSDSSDSSSSSGSSSSSYSGSSSSSRSSSGSPSSSGSDSDSNDDKKSKHSKNSSRHSSDSSSYSYSTGGSAAKNTMRSVISHKDSRRSRSPRRSPRGRWSPRGRKYSDKRRSYDRDDNYRRNVNRKDRVRSSRDKSPRFIHRRSPHSRLGRRPSSPRDYRKDRNRSRERDRPRDFRYNRPNERPRLRRTRSKSVEDKNHSSEKNNLSRTDDDFVEINVDQKRHVKESRLKKSGRLAQRRVNANVRGPGFDLRSRLGPKKSETNLIITKNIDARQNLIQRQVTEQAKEDEIEVEGDEEYVDDEEQNGDDYDNYVTSPSLSRKPRSNLLQEDKEAELDARILRIEKMNEEIRKRQEEIEQEKMLYS